MAAALGFFQDLLSKVTMGFMLPVILDKNIDQALLSGPKSIQELTAGTQINPERLHRFLTHLESNGLFSFDQETHKWSHNELSTSLTVPFINHMCKFQLSTFILTNFLYLDKIIESDQNAYQIRGKTTIFEEMKNDPKVFKNFHNHMEAFTVVNEGALVNGFNLDGVNRLLDIGGANGSLCISLNKKYPEIQFGNFDLPDCAEMAQKNIRDHALTEKIQFITGNFLETVPKGFDALAIKHVLCDWAEDAVSTILKNCREALENGQKLFIIEVLLDKASQNYTLRTDFDIKMLVYLNGKFRTTREFEELLSKNRFRLEKVFETEFDSIIEAIAV